MSLLAATCAAVAAYLLVTTAATWNQPRRVRPSRPRRRRRPSLGVRLRQAGVAMSPGRYRATVFGSTVAAFVVVWGLVGSVPLAGLASAGVGFAPRGFYSRRQQKALAARIGAWPEAIRDVLMHLSVRKPLHRALVELGHSGPLPLRPAWRRYAGNAELSDTPTALELVRAELADPVSDQVIEAFLAAHERGQEVAIAVLRSMADNVSRDVQLRERVITGQTEIRSQGVLVVVLPFVVLAFLISSHEGFRDFYSTAGGWVVITIGAGMALLGWKLIAALGRIPLDPRILTRRGGR